MTDYAAYSLHWPTVLLTVSCLDEAKSPFHARTVTLNLFRVYLEELYVGTQMLGLFYPDCLLQPPRPKSGSATCEHSRQVSGVREWAC